MKKARDSTIRCIGKTLMDNSNQDAFPNPLLTRDNMDRYLVRSGILRALKGFLPHCKGTLLDIGCGEMPYKSIMLESNSRIKKYVGLDIENLKYQQSIKPDLYWEGRQIPLADSSVDCAMATELFEHLPDVEAVLKEVRRVLKPGGSLFFTVPFLWPLHDMPQDEYRYTPFSLQRHLQNAGFANIQLNALGGWDASLAQMIGLWVIRRPMSDERRNEFIELLFPFYKELVESEMKNEPVRYDEMLQQSLMITGLTGTAVKPFVSVVRRTKKEKAERPMKKFATVSKNTQYKFQDNPKTPGECQCDIGKKDEAMWAKGRKRSSDPVLAVVCPQLGAASETFIRKHIEMLLPERTVVLTGSVVDGSWLHAPVKVVPHTYGGETYTPDVETDITRFLKEHGVTHILCEFGSVGTGMVSLNDRLLHLPLYVHFHGQDASEELRKPEMVSYYRWMGSRVSGVIAVSRPMAERLNGIGIPEEKITVISCGVSVPEDTFASPEKSPCRFISVSRLVPKKGLLYLLDAFGKARKVYPDMTLDIIGDGPMREEIEEFIRRRDMQDSARLHGQREHKDVLNWLTESSVYAQHSITDPATGNAEGMPVGIMEAAAFGLPVISTFHEGIPDAVEHTVSGFLVNEGDSDRMAEYMVRLANDGMLRKEMGLAGRRKIAAGFASEISLRKLREFMGIPAEGKRVQRVLFVNHNLAPYEYSGTPITTLNHALGMRELGLDVAVLIPDPGIKDNADIGEISDITLYTVPRLDKYATFLDTIDQEILESYLQGIDQIIREFSPDVVHINDYVYMPSQIIERFHKAGCIVVRSVCNDEEICHRDYPVIAAGLESRLCTGPEAAAKCAECFLASHNDPSDADMPQDIEGRISARAARTQHLYDWDIDAVIFTEAHFRDHFKRFMKVPDKKIRVIPRGFHFEFPRVHAVKTARSDIVRFAFIGNVMFSKGMDMVLKAFEILSGAGGFTLDIIGNIADEAFLPWINRLQEIYPEKISFHGPFKKDDLLQIAGDIDICIIPSYFDTYNRVVREMLYCGVPLITTDFFGASIVQDGFNGLKIPVGDHQALAASMKKIIDRPSLVQTFSEGVLKTLVPTLSDEINAIQEFYEYLYAQKHSHTHLELQEDVPDPEKPSVRFVAFYLPQFHPIPENDAWWGKGFTEWVNVSQAKPLFSGHDQPRYPADLGFYDLRLPEARYAQAEMARQYGIEGFCYWHYWFAGKRLLEKPFNQVLDSGEPDLPFCLAWANETWSRRWLGEEKSILMKQTYSDEDDISHIRWLLKAFNDPRYIRIDNRPVFLIYRPHDLPDARKTTDVFREECIRSGLPEPYLVGINAHRRELDCRCIGFDHTLDFMPQLGNLPDVMNDEPSGTKRARNLRFGIKSEKLKIYDYSETLDSMLSNKKSFSHPVIPSLFAGWDNTPRRKENAVVILNSTPEKFGKALADLSGSVQDRPVSERFVFINAWNEWAEGNYLEPDTRHGLRYLEEVKKAHDFLPDIRREDETIIEMKETPQEENTEKNNGTEIRAVAFYLPQFHPIPENDAWWGKGFTEWTNVQKADPLFEGHYQPHIPGELGYYDLRSAEARKKQADLARAYGISGFCYYHYWFRGKRLLHLPIDEVLASGEPDFPFCFCWANEKWTRVWDGAKGDVLIDQTYSEEDDLQHIRFLCQAFQDRRYIRINGKPLFLVYRANQLPDARRTTALWREEARRLGIGEIYLCRVESFIDERSDPNVIGFDAAVEFQPDWTQFREKLTGPAYRSHNVYDYEVFVKRMLRNKPTAYRRFPCVTPAWDNSPRRKSNATIFINSTPESYEKWLSGVVENLSHSAENEKVLFLNAWNEWAEGNHLEPDQRHGRAYLEATKRALQGTREDPLMAGYEKVQHFVEKGECQDEVVEICSTQTVSTVQPEVHPSVSVIIPVSGNLQSLHACLKTILKSVEYDAYKIVLVKNGQTEETQKYFASIRKNGIESVVFPEDTSIADCCNAAAEMFQAEYYLFMGPSIQATKGWFIHLLNAVRSNGNVDAVTAKIIRSSGEIIEAGYSFLDREELRGNGEGSAFDTPGFNYRTEIQSGSRYLLLVSREAWTESGRFDSRISSLSAALMDVGLSLHTKGRNIQYQPKSVLMLRETERMTIADNERKSPEPEIISKLRPSPDQDFPDGFTIGNGRKKNILVLGIYLADKLNNVDDTVQVLSASERYAVTQRWVALNGDAPSQSVADVTVNRISGEKPKFQIVNALLSAEDLSRYEYVVIVDDDVVLPFHFMDSFIHMQDSLSFAIAQPARTGNSYADHPIVTRHRGLQARETRFVEIGPVVSFHKSAYDMVFPFDITSPMGWGYENVWSYQIKQHGMKMGVIDCIPVDHSLRKPVAHYDWSEADKERKAFLEKQKHTPMEECFTVVNITE
jgi:glycosyltransferase involved in cell wall biosynthesis/lipopolysaccharide biosynthesis protein/SAM-dependent methyltransferase